MLECRRKGLRYVLSPPHDPERLKIYLDRLAELPIPADDNQLAFYVDDEPEMRAVPAGRTEDVQRLVKGRFPRASTGMAIVRPSYCREYLRASDFFMIDNYPFPDMPMSWLGDSMDRAADEAGRDRLLSVIQAFSVEPVRNRGSPEANPSRMRTRRRREGMADGSGCAGS